MAMILNRQEFADYFNDIQEGLGNLDSPLWVPDQFDIDTVPNWFVCVKPLRVTDFKLEYWAWCNATLKNLIRCYSSDPDNQEEWWGFVDKEDIAIWMLKWT